MDLNGINLDSLGVIDVIAGIWTLVIGFLVKMVKDDRKIIAEKVSPRS